MEDEIIDNKKSKIKFNKNQIDEDLLDLKLKKKK
jgi:hypothetical protein